MAVATFDTLKFANTLKAAGVPEKQAEAQAVAFAEVIQINLKDLVTKDDLAQAVVEVRKEIQLSAKDTKDELKSESLKLNGKIDTIDARLRGEMLLLKWMFGATLTGMVGILIRLLVYRTP